MASVCAVRAERHGEDLTGMRGQGGTRLLAGGYVPQLYGPVGTSGGQQVSVRAEGYGVDLSRRRR